MQIYGQQKSGQTSIIALVKKLKIIKSKLFTSVFL